MCGIIGYSGTKNANDILINGLYALEYRGYDSAGIATQQGGDFLIKKSNGRAEMLAKKCNLNGNCGIGHTRWATHGEPSEINAHPHASNTCVLVHNGIIENYLKIKKQLKSKGYNFKSQTDTECIVHLIDSEYKKTHNAKSAILTACEQLVGSYAFAVMFCDREGEIWAIRRDNPLIITQNTDGCYIASDIPAIAPYSNKVFRPKDNQLVCVTATNITAYNANGESENIEFETLQHDFLKVEKDGFEYFMLKEIHEQPQAIYNAASEHMGKNGLPDLSGINLDQSKLKQYDTISIVGCGSATHAGMVGKYLIEQLANVPVIITTASEYRYCPPVCYGKTLTIAISQSGETADTLAAVRGAKQNGGEVLGIVNAVASAIARESDYVMYTNAGTEIAVATTKGYTTQLASLTVFALALALSKQTISQPDAKKIFTELLTSVPKAVKKVIDRQDEIKAIAKKIKTCTDLYFIGRGEDSVAGVECSLKLKEISYIHSEAYAAGELKHGTLSLIEKGTPVIALACVKDQHEKMIGNIKEVAARGADITLVCTPDFKNPNDYCDDVFVLPEVCDKLCPLVSVVFAQILAYETAIMRGCDVDKPRNLAKSVTVE